MGHGRGHFARPNLGNAWDDGSRRRSMTLFQRFAERLPDLFSL
jgi:hypothetical protein